MPQGRQGLEPTQCQSPGSLSRVSNKEWADPSVSTRMQVPPTPLFAMTDWQTALLKSHCISLIAGLVYTFFIIFTFAHLYMSFREDVMGGATTISSMTTGLRMFKETHH